MTNEEALKNIRKLSELYTLFEGDIFSATCDMAISALEKQKQYAWHDLRENPDDLPEEDEDKLLVRDIYWHYKKEAYLPEYEFATYFKGQWFVNGGNMKEKIIAWRYIEPFEEGA